MKRIVRFSSLLLSIVLAFSLIAAPASAAENDEIPEADIAASGAAINILSYVAGSDTAHPTTISTQAVGNRIFLFLPSSADLSALALNFSGTSCMVIVGDRIVTVQNGELFDFASLFPSVPENGQYIARFHISGTTYVVTVMHSKAIRSMFITSSDPAKGHKYIDAIKGNKAKDNEMVLLSDSGECIYEGVMKEIKGRGNSTWYYPKKPYQIKLNEKADLLGAGKDEKAKTWILLANYYDNSLIRNSLTNDLGTALGLNYSHNCEFVDLYYDGEYCGCYLLSEKTEIDDARVDIRDLESEIEDVNGDIDFDELSTAIIKNSRGNIMQVVEGIALPEDYSGGYLLEIDYAERAAAEKSWFSTSRNQYVVSKSPEYLPAEAMEYISCLYQDFEDAVYNRGIHPVTGKHYTEYVDLRSLAMSYLLLTFTQNGDAFLSSTFFYVPEGESKLYAGPVWDFDTAYGLYFESDKTGMLPARTEFALKLLQLADFRAVVTELWNGCLRDIISGIVLSRSAETSASGVKSIAGYAAECSSSRMMDAIRWDLGSKYAAADEKLYSFVQESFNWVGNELLSPDAPWANGPFVDVDPGIWYADAVSYVTEKGYFSGTTSTEFSPSSQMTRAMLVTVLYRMAGSPAVTGTSPYIDVAPGAFYHDAVIWANENGISGGYGNGIFGVDDPVTREQMTAFLYRFSALMGDDVSSPGISDEYADKTSVSDWAVDAFGWAIAEGIINGVGVETPLLDPQGTATRAMTATIVYRYDN